MCEIFTFTLESTRLFSADGELYYYVINHLHVEADDGKPSEGNLASSMPVSAASNREPNQYRFFFKIPNMTVKVRGRGRCNRPPLRLPTETAHAQNAVL